MEKNQHNPGEPGVLGGGGGGESSNTGYGSAPGPPGFAVPPYPAYPRAGPEYGEVPPPYFEEQKPVIQAQPAQVTIQVVDIRPLGGEPTRLICPHCRADVETKVKYSAGNMTHLCACILCCFICWPLAWLPYVIDSCQNAEHTCPNCNAFLGEYRR